RQWAAEVAASRCPVPPLPPCAALCRLGLFPQLVERCKARSPQLYAPGCSEAFHRFEALAELLVRTLERRARIDRQLAREVHDREQQIAQLGLRRFPFPFSRFPLQL